jgi:hypothetical protein
VDLSSFLSALALLCLVCTQEAIAADKVLWLDKKAKVAVTRLALGYVYYPSDLYDHSGESGEASRPNEGMDRELRAKLQQKIGALGYGVEDTTGGIWYEGISKSIDLSYGGLQAAIGPQPQTDAIQELAESGKQEWVRYPEILPSGTVLLAFGVYKQDVLIARDMLSNGYHSTMYVTVVVDILKVESGKKPSILWANTNTLSADVVNQLGRGLRVDPAEARHALSQGLDALLATLPACRGR